MEGGGVMGKPKVNWDYDNCYEVAKGCSYRADLKNKYPQAYRTALKNGWINDYTWFKTKGEAIAKRKTVCTKEYCYEEAKKYTSKIDFLKNSNRAYVVAKKNGWIEEYTWLIHPKQYKGKYDYDYCYEEARKYKTRKDFQVGCSCGYHHARINKWLDDYTWFIHPEISNKKWNKETCFNEAKKYETLGEFAEKSLGAYTAALKNRWLGDYNWLKRKQKPNGYWDYDKCFNEAIKFSSRREFKEGCDSAYRSSIKNGWIDEYTWFTKPNKKWTYETCMEESKKYSSRGEFALGSSGAYHVASENKWLDDYTWLPLDGRGLGLRLEKYGKWTKEACFEEAKKYKTRTEFAKGNNSAYNNARQFKWIDDYYWLKDERLDLIEGKIDLVYSYEFIEENAVYVGRTLIKRSKERDRQHLFNSDSVSSFAKEMDVPVPEMKVLESGLTLEEGVQKEAWWIEKYREDGWRVLNKAKAGSIGLIGKGKTRYTKEICIELSKECIVRAEFKIKYPQAYKVAFTKGWINEFVWLKDGKEVGADKRRKYDRKTCYEEAKKYNTITDFEKGSKGACIAARKNGWMKDYTWFTLLWQEKWSKDTCFKEAKKYTKYEDFRMKSGPAYAVACKNGWIDDYDWLERKRIRRGTWKSYEKCYEEALKYTRKCDFEQYSNSAYNSSVRNGWIEKFTWLKLTRKPRNYWDHTHCYSEAKKYTKVLDFQKGSSSAYHAAVKGGWLKEYTWLKISRKPRNYWNYEHCYSEAQKYTSIRAYQRGSSGSYNVAHKNGWVKDYTWFKKNNGQLDLFDSI